MNENKIDCESVYLVADSKPAELNSKPISAAPVSPAGADEIGPLTIRSKVNWKLLLCMLFVVSVVGFFYKPLYHFAMGGALGMVIAAAINLVIGRAGAANLTLSSEGIEWHGPKNPTGKKLVPWTRLRLVGVYRHAWRSLSEQKNSPRTLVLNFSDIPDIPINLNTLTPSEQEHCFRILSRYAPQRLLAPEVLYMQVQSLLGKAPSVDGFTQIWSQEFDRRFELANHVSLPAGKKVGSGRYTVELTIATRMSSSTYLVSDSKGQRFVVKELVVPVGADEKVHNTLLQQFNREAAILASLSHPLIVTVRDHFVEDGRSYIVMDCIHGTNLRNYVRSLERVDKRVVVSIARQLLEVLSYLHNLSPPVIHRDLTPDNIMHVGERDEIKVIDFGAANIYTSEGTGTLIGKQGYMPPEQFKGKASPESDVYAFGSTLLFLLTGEDPPGMCRVPESNRQIDEELINIVRSCLQFELTDRPSVETLIEQFDVLAQKWGAP